MRYMLFVYVVAFIIAYVLFGWIALIHPVLTAIILGSFLGACKLSERKRNNGTVSNSAN